MSCNNPNFLLWLLSILVMCCMMCHLSLRTRVLFSPQLIVLTLISNKHKCALNRRPVGETLYLTPYIDAGDIENARELARVIDPLPGVGTEAPESYSGYLTVNEATNSNMFFWFFPAAVYNLRHCCLFFQTNHKR